ncbi:MAG: hypothetical protein J5588_05260 [Bacteroidales bacterium]|nr:hypothetical protein [Bacteroidales bacterium]
MTTQKTSSKNRSYELKKLKAECVAEENKRYNTSQKFRKNGISAVEEGNKGLKATKCEVFLYIVSKDATQANSLQEQFKTIKGYRKTKAFASVAEVSDYVTKSKYNNNTIIILTYVTPEDENSAEIQSEIEAMKALKAVDPSMDMMVLTGTTLDSGSVDFNSIYKSNESFAQILKNVTWAVREQDRIRRQVEAKQFIRVAIISFFSFFVLLFAVDFITGLMDDNPNPSGIFGILPIPHD